jgi:hypothetical protein
VWFWSSVVLVCVLALASALLTAAQPLSQQLREIATVTVAVVNLEYEGSVLPVTVRTMKQCFFEDSLLFSMYMRVFQNVYLM